MSTSVSVIIVNYNAGALLTRSLEALRKQTLRPQQIYVVDNASQDGSCDRVPTDFPEVHLNRLRRNIGFAAGNNLAIRRADSCEWIALLNPDAIPAENWLEQLLATADKNPQVACFASRMIQQYRSAYLDGAGDVYHTSGLVWHRGHDLPVEGLYLKTDEVFSACAAAALYRRNAFEAVGCFDEDFFCYLEDVDLGFRLRLAGYRCIYVPDAVVWHVGSATTERESDFAVYHGHRNLVWTYVKNMPGLLFWLYLPLHIAGNMYIVIRYALKGRWRVILKAKWDACVGIPWMWKKRRKIQASRAAVACEIRKLMAKGLLRRSRDG